METLYLDKVKEKAIKYIDDNALIDDEDTIIIGLSGGPDSIFLAKILIQLRTERNLKLYAVHFNHGLRKESNDEEILISEFCKNERLDYEIIRLNVKEYAEKNKLSIEVAARKLRLKHFKEVSKKLNNAKIALAHHSDDAIETFFLNLCRGSSVFGLSSIKNNKSLNIIRPILTLRKNEILEYLSKKNIGYCIDKTNFETRFTRNKIRNELVPYLEENINQRSGEHILKIINEIGCLNSYLDESINKLMTRVVVKNDKIIIPLSLFGKMPDIIYVNLLKTSIQKAFNIYENVYFKHYESVLKLVNKKTSSIINLPENIVAYRDYNELIIYRGNSNNDKYHLELKVTDIVEVIDYRNIEREEFIKYIDADRVHDVLEFRHRKSGDFIIIDSKNHKKSLNRYMIDNKISRQRRDEMYVVADGNEIVWIVGYRLSYRYRLNNSTRNILRLEIK